MSPESEVDHEIGRVQFLQWTDLYLTEKPFQLFLDIDPNAADQRKTNLVFEEKDIHVTSLRGQEHLFSLDQNGFIVRKFSEAASCFQETPPDEDLVETKYFPAVERLLRKEVDGIDRVFLLDWRVRSANPTTHEKATSIDLLDRTSSLKPANYAHIDQSPLASINHVLRELPDDAEYLLGGRTRVIKQRSQKLISWNSVWLPLRHVVTDWPLALCDGRTVSLQDDLIETDTVRRNYQGANMYMIHRDEHRWYFLRGQGTDEVLIFKQFDTNDTEAGVCPHVSFKLKNSPENSSPRESIEMRILAFTYPD
ncbi:hypothetical protein CJF32_00002342 [Rutstroemia sp. NJR-2017a WRK4]|nr:hypothetical protein CJF32_00002217 [Rutstroemia sp. NJR-2017a WRK4]PQE14826.1 hypothetical protein CJF32_00002342 [Rutstroemia sp. NJR-2017a WRK4]